MLTKKQLKVLKVFRKNIFRSISFSDIKKELNEKSTSKIQFVLGIYDNENLIKTESIGKTKLVSLNLENNKVFYYLGLFDLEFSNLQSDILDRISSEISKETEFFSLVVFGSHAKQNFDKESDLDIALILNDLTKKTKILPRINSVKRKSLLDIDFHVISRNDFLNMLNEEKENLGKEICRNNIVYHGPEIFFNLLLKGGKNVFS